MAMQREVGVGDFVLLDKIDLDNFMKNLELRNGQSRWNIPSASVKIPNERLVDLQPLVRHQEDRKSFLAAHLMFNVVSYVDLCYGRLLSIYRGNKNSGFSITRLTIRHCRIYSNELGTSKTGCFNINYFHSYTQFGVADGRIGHLRHSVCNHC
ncbi:hypothetical protein NQ317_006808 [Molorchus minor]|uniref:Uncharacterized protein n=1 Tax=Molorchus minor TaxID=1323400 RepID=A0ABQ9JGW8_9CUCU|nr:hypothetical protein NQ317_006808 [Molorchus minor]